MTNGEPFVTTALTAMQHLLYAVSWATMTTSLMIIEISEGRKVVNNFLFKCVDKSIR